MTYETVIIKEIPDRIVVNSTSDIYQLIKPHIQNRQEQTVLVTLANKNIVIGVHVVHVGTANATYTIARDIFYRAIMDNAVSIILCHNHPSGELTPSQEDLRNADTFFMLGKLHGIRVMDQLVISEYGYTSMKPNAKSIAKFMKELNYDV
jgi:DNA repair protein RadC